MITQDEELIEEGAIILHYFNSGEAIEARLKPIIN